MSSAAYSMNYEQEDLAHNFNGLTLGSGANSASNNNNNDSSQNSQETNKNGARTSRRRALHAFHDFNIHSTDNGLYVQHSIDPNEAASAVGLLPPHQISTPDLSAYPRSEMDKNYNNNNNSIDPAALACSSEYSENPVMAGYQIPRKNSSRVSPNTSVVRLDSHFSSKMSAATDLYNINQPIVVEDLSVPFIKAQANETYADKTFLSFEHVLPPPAGAEFKAKDQGNSIPQFSRMSMYSVPFSEELREQTKIPLGMVLRPFADCVPEGEIPMEVPQVKIHDGQVVPRCSRCRAYLNPGMQHAINVMKCNICGFSSPVPIEYASAVDSNGIRDDYHIRPELHTGVVDYVVPKEYNFDPESEPKPLHRVFLIDLSYSSYKSKLVETACSAIRVALYKDDGTPNLPSGTLVSIIGYDNNLHFYNLSPDIEQTTVSLVTDLDDPFIPFEDGLFADPIVSYSIIESTLTTIEQNSKSLAVEPALGAALKISGDLLKNVGGGQIVSVLSTIPSLGPGALTMKTNSKDKLDIDFVKETFTADNKFYQELTNEFVKNNIGVNLFVASTSNVDLINLGTFANNTGGTIKEWLPFNVERDDITLIFEIKKVIDNIAGYQCQLKIRCSRGLQVNKYYGPFKTMSGDASPNLSIVSGDTSIATDFIYDSNLDTKKDAHFQAALLYTTKEGVRKVRVINSILSVTQRIADVFDFCDQDTVNKLLIKRILENFRKSTIVALKNTLVMQCCEIMAAYKHYISRYNALPTQLVLPQSLRTLPMFILAILKSQVFRTKIEMPDSRVDSLFKLSQYDLGKMSVYLYPYLFCIHSLEEGDFMVDENSELKLIHIPKSIPMTVSNLDYGGAYLAFNGDRIIIWLHSEVNILLLKDLFGPEVSSIEEVPSHISSMPVLDTYISQQVRNMCDYLARHFNGLEKQSVEVCRFRMDSNEYEFQRMFVEDRADDLVWSYTDFLKEVHKQIDIKTNGLASDSSNVNNDGENLSRRFGIF